jgi:hypothetical protein
MIVRDVGRILLYNLERIKTVMGTMGRLLKSNKRLSLALILCL